LRHSFDHFNTYSQLSIDAKKEVHKSIVEEPLPETATKEKRSRERRYSDGDFHFDQVPEYLNTEDKRVVNQFNNDVLRNENTTVRKVPVKELG
jgi:hypothetical protein